MIVNIDMYIQSFINWYTSFMINMKTKKVWINSFEVVKKGLHKWRLSFGKAFPHLHEEEKTDDPSSLSCTSGHIRNIDRDTIIASKRENIGSRFCQAFDERPSVGQWYAWQLKLALSGSEIFVSKKLTSLPLKGSGKISSWIAINLTMG